VAGNILGAWLLTLPGAGLVAAALYFPVSWIF
jgi:phosphate/sulfate permease